MSVHKRGGKKIAHVGIAKGQLSIFGEAPPGVEAWSPPTSFPRLSGLVTVDCETRDPAISTHGPGWPTGNGDVVGVSLSTPDGWRGYYPFGHAGGGNLDRGIVTRFLQDELNKPDVTWVCHNAGYDIGWLGTLGVRPHHLVHDTQLMLALVDENRHSYSLDNGAADYTTVRKDEAGLKAWAHHWGVNPKSEMWKLPAAGVGIYAEGDVIATWELFKALEPLIVSEGLTRVYELERNVTRALVGMRKIGIPVDIDRAEQLRKKYLREEADVSERMQTLVGAPVAAWDADSVAEAFKRRGLIVPRTEKTGAPSITKEWLDACPDELAAMVRRYRTLNKMRTTFVEGSVLHVAQGDRIYPEFHSARSDDGGAVTGRSSCSNPNLQFFPGRSEEFTKDIRGLCKANPGESWHAADYSQQEPRLLVHFAALLDLTGAREARDAYRNNPLTDFHQFAAELTGLVRKKAKDINLGLFYGMGGAKLCRSLGLPTEWVVNERTGKRYEVAGPEGQAMLDQYNERMPFVKQMYDSAKRLGETRGYVRTLAGRRRRCQSTAHPRGAFPHKMLNAVIQGSAADQTKYATVAAYDAGLTVFGPIHDELAISALASPLTSALIREVMCDCVTLEVPSVVDIAIGPSWGEASE